MSSPQIELVELSDPSAESNVEDTFRTVEGGDKGGNDPGAHWLQEGCWL